MDDNVPLDGLLTLRRADEAEAKRRFGLARILVANARDALVLLQRRLADATAAARTAATDSRELPTHGASAAALVRAESFVAHRRELAARAATGLTRSERSLDEAVAALEHARAAVETAIQRREAAEGQLARRRSNSARDRQQREQTASDDSRHPTRR